MDIYRHALPVIGNRGTSNVDLVAEMEEEVEFKYRHMSGEEGIIKLTQEHPLDSDLSYEQNYLIYWQAGREYRDYDMIQHIPLDAHEDLARGCMIAFIKGIEHLYKKEGKRK